jgi:isopenicillin-N N-acyltransferase-like protein
VVTYPHIRVEGDATGRGRQYGEQARERIERSVVAYREVFQHYAGWDWSQVREFAAGFEDPIRAFSSKYADELAGMAHGAGFDLLDLLAINVRTEILYSARVRQAMNLPHECTSFALVPSAGSAEPLVMGQNWDWLTHTFDTVVVLEARQDEGPSYVTVVEAGLLAKTGMNSYGLGLVTNALASNTDVGEPGIPYHVFLRSFLDCATVTDAVGKLQQHHRSSSANYLVGHASGVALDVESTPGDFTRMFVVPPDDGVLVHANHFVAPRFDGDDVSLWTSPDSLGRYSRLLSGLRHEKVGIDDLKVLLADHADHPFGVCSHPDTRLDPVEQGATIASVIMNLEERTLWLADGPPCSVEFRRLDYTGFFAGDKR